MSFELNRKLATKRPPLATTANVDPVTAATIGTPHLTFVSGFTVRYGLMMQEDFDWGPGDVFIGNDPDYGGGHLPDYLVYAPVYDDKGELLLVQVLQAHQGDTGGKDP